MENKNLIPLINRRYIDARRNMSQLKRTWRLGPIKSMELKAGSQRREINRGESRSGTFARINCDRQRVSLQSIAGKAGGN